MATAHLTVIHDKLRRYKRKYYTNVALRGLIILTAFLSTVYVTMVLFEHFAHTNSTIRTVLFFSFLAMLGVTAYVWVINPLLRLYNLSSGLTNEKASLLIGNHFPTIKDKLLNTLQLGQQSSVDNSLLTATIEQRTSDLNKFSFNEAIDLGENRRLFKYIFFPALAIAIIAIVNSEILTNSTDRLLNYNQEYVPQAPWNYNIDDKKLETFRNEEFVLNLNVDGKELPNEIFLVQNGRRRRMNKEDLREFSYSFGKLEENTTFHLESGGYKSETYTVTVMPRPELKTFTANLDYPAYLSKKDEILENTGNLSVPEGTKVTWNFEVRDVKSLKVRFQTEKEIITADRASENKFVFKKRMKRSDEYQVRLKNEFGGNKDEILYSIRVTKDQYPKINLKAYQDTILFNYLVLGGNISDDYGLSDLRLYYNIVDKEGKQKYKANKSKRIRINRKNKSEHFFYQFNLDSLELGEGESLEYFMKVWDNDGVNGHKSSKSLKQRFKIPDAAEVEKSIEKSTQVAENQIDKSLEKAQKMNEELKKLQERIKSKKKLDWQDKKMAEDLLKKHKELEKELEKMRENFQQQNEKSQRFNKQDEKLQEKVQMLQKLMDEVMDEKTKKLYEELQKLLNDQVKQDELQKLLDKMEKEDVNVEKELERAMEMFKQLKFEQKLKESIDKLKDLAEEQKDLSEETKEKNSDLEGIQKKQDELDKKFEDVKKDMKELNDINESMENKKDLEDTKSEQESIEQDMQKSQENLQKNKKNKASESQKSAGDKMEKMAQKMQDMQSSMQQQQMEEDLDALRDILENLITLSYDQEELMTSFKKVSQSDPRFIELSQTQLKLEDDAQIIEDSLYALAKRVFQIESFVTREVSKMKGHMSKSVEALKARKPGKASGNQQFAMTSMNNLALLLDDVLKQMQQQMGQQMKGDQMCNKPGSKGKPKMGDMQQQLNNMINNLKKSGKSGRQLSEELAKLAAKQEMIRRAMKQMEDEMKKNGQNPGNQISEIQKKMEETEKDLVNKQLTPEMIKRQKEILVRLLEAEKSIRERDLEEKRESKTGKQEERNIPPNFEEYLKMKKKQVELLKTLPPNLAPYYKNKVNEYFDKIEY